MWRFSKEFKETGFFFLKGKKKVLSVNCKMKNFCIFYECFTIYGIRFSLWPRCLKFAWKFHILKVWCIQELPKKYVLMGNLEICMLRNLVITIAKQAGATIYKSWYPAKVFIFFWSIFFKIHCPEAQARMPDFVAEFCNFGPF